MTATADIAVPRDANRGLRVALIIIAAVKTLLAVWLFNSAFDLHDEPFSITKALINGKIALDVVLSIAALAFVIRRRLPAAIIALGIYTVLAWFADLPGLIGSGIAWNLSMPSVMLFLQQIIYPLLAMVAIWLAWQHRALHLATVLVALPLADLLIGMGIFTLAVVIYGF